jgi:hypothetical protein
MDDKQTEREVQRTLDLLTATPHVRPRPFFYTRLKARMQAPPPPAVGVARLLHHRVALTVLGVVMLIALNAFSLLHFVSQGTATQQARAIVSFAQEYNISTYKY